MQESRSRAGADGPAGLLSDRRRRSSAFVLWGVLATDEPGEHRRFRAQLGDRAASAGCSCWPRSSFLGFAVVIWASRASAKLRLGQDDEQPEFRTASWVAMMFSAGMGIGLMFYGVGEPLSHMAAPPNGAAQPEHRRGRRGRHGVLVLPLGPPPVGDLRGRGPRARVLRPPQGRAEPDLVGASARCSAIASRARSARRSTGWRSSRRCSAARRRSGLGALQINSGMNFLWGVEASNGFAVAIIAALTADASSSPPSRASIAACSGSRTATWSWPCCC